MTDLRVVRLRFGMSADPGLRTPKLTLGGYQDLRVWQVAVELATECYLLTARFPDHERFGMTAQMRRAAVSVVSNIAEGHGRASAGAFSNHLSVARGSAKELESQAILATHLKLAQPADVEKLLRLSASTGKMLHALRAALRRDGIAPVPRPRTPDDVTRQSP